MRVFGFWFTVSTSVVKEFAAVLTLVPKSVAAAVAAWSSALACCWVWVWKSRRVWICGMSARAVSMDCWTLGVSASGPPKIVVVLRFGISSRVRAVGSDSFAPSVVSSAPLGWAA